MDFQNTQIGQLSQLLRNRTRQVVVGEEQVGALWTVDRDATRTFWKQRSPTASALALLSQTTVYDTG